MTAEQRRSRISARLHEAHQPISATALAKELGVSRQIIVGDVALLRAAGQAITATARGYVIPDAGETGLPRQVACRHDGTGTRDELNAMVTAAAPLWTSSWTTRSMASCPPRCTCAAAWTWSSSWPAWRGPPPCPS